MGIVRRYWEIIKLVFKYLRFKYHQYSLKTKETFEVTTTYGKIRGCKRYSVWNDTFYSFEKIPFAKPPLNELRFKAPQPPEPWTDIKDCTSEGPVPLQTNLISKFVEGSEDCLYLNVYTKNLEPIKPMPVMVWIYGGGFETGGATKDLYSPDYFMQKDVVLITIAYRLGPFGFLSFNDPELDIPGNAGLKDQVLALKWIKSNCSIFGGNPDSITLFGESAGAASAHYMMLTQQTKGLFHRAILMSGTALCPWALLPERQIAYRLAKGLGYKDCRTNDDKKLYNFIQNAKGKCLLAAERNILTADDKNKRIVFPFGPSIEPYLTADCVIPEHPRIMMQKAWSNKIPMIIGGTSDEGLLFYPETKAAPGMVNNLGNCVDLIPQELNLNSENTELLDYGLKLRNAYFKGFEPNISKLHEYLELMSHKMFWHPIHRTILSRLEYATETQTYLYRFNVDSEFFNLFRLLLCGPKKRGVCHADDLGYLFLNMWSSDIISDSREYKAIQEFLGAFVKFAETGNPNHEKLKSGVFNEPINWETLNKFDVNDSNKMICLEFSFNTKLIPLPEYEKHQLWDSFYYKESLI